MEWQEAARPVVSVVFGATFGMKRSSERVCRWRRFERNLLAFVTLAIDACIAYIRRMQYTIRGLPVELDRLIRKRAKEEGKSLNTVAVEALMEAFGLRGSVPVVRDLGSLMGSWVEDPAVDEALEEQRVIDDEMWR